jgi:cell wall-associated NlpC family hydrolase
VTHWAANYIGQPWVAGVGDCWALARRVWHERFGWSVPAIGVNSASAIASRRAFADAGHFAAWAEVSDPREGDAVLMARGHYPCHVGVYVDGGRVLHSVEGTGAVLSQIARLRDMGYSVAGFWRYAG